MNREVEKTLVLDFGGEQAVSAGGTLLAAWDDSRNVDTAGEPKTQFVPGESAWLIAQHDATVRITRVLATAGEVQAQGEVSVGREDELGFGDAEDEQRLSWFPLGGVSPQWYGRQGSGMKVVGQTVTVAAGHPCLAKLIYTARVRLYRLQTPVVALAKGEQWPIRVYIYYVEAR